MNNFHFYKNFVPLKNEILFWLTTAIHFWQIVFWIYWKADKGFLTCEQIIFLKFQKLRFISKSELNWNKKDDDSFDITRKKAPLKKVVLPENAIKGVFLAENGVVGLMMGCRNVRYGYCIGFEVLLQSQRENFDTVSGIANISLLERMNFRS